MSIEMIEANLRVALAQQVAQGVKIKELRRKLSAAKAAEAAAKKKKK